MTDLVMALRALSSALEQIERNREASREALDNYHLLAKDKVQKDGAHLRLSREHEELGPIQPKQLLGGAG